jgi:guanosine-3',5'-bis(diphosphate) 3'-pyrophosphohydrolase
MTKEQNMSALSFEAMMFAREVHADQRRKYTDAPYSDHLAEVAGIVATVAPDDMLDTMVAVAWLHDCVEDQGVELADLFRRFGSTVALGVEALSDLETGNRATRKAASRERLAASPGWVQTIKCADLISNTSSIVQHDPKFAETYLAEKRALLDVMALADERLIAVARALAA